MDTMIPVSILPGVVWPALPSAEGAHELAMLYQLEKSEKWAPEQLLEVQFRQLSELLLHAWKTCPFYRASLLRMRKGPGCSDT